MGLKIYSFRVTRGHWGKWADLARLGVKNFFCQNLMIYTPIESDFHADQLFLWMESPKMHRFLVLDRGSLKMMPNGPI